LIETVANFIDKYKLNNKTIVVGFSGGFDSMCLLHVLNKLSISKNLNIIAAHLNHNWRGEKSDIEQDNCNKFCEKYNLKFYSEKLSADVKKTETEARELRYQFFEKVMKLFSADAVFTAHNYDDNAETILYRMFKGTGIVGLQGILPKRDFYYRPLLNVKRKDIEKYCYDNNLSPNFDESNNNIKYKRNLIRCEILPLIEKINPEIKKTINNLALVCQSECNIIDEYLNKVVSSLENNEKLNSSKYNTLSDDLKKRIIYNMIYNSEIDYDFSKITDIFNFIENTLNNGTPSKMSLAADKWLYVDSSDIEIISAYEKDNNEVLVNDIGKYSLADAEFEIEKVVEREQTENEATAFVDLSNIDKLVLRTRRNGDIITPLGSNNKVKLKKYLIDKKIAQHKRDKLVLLCSENEVLWVAGVGLSDKIKVTDSPTHKLSIRYNRGMNYETC